MMTKSAVVRVRVKNKNAIKVLSYVSFCNSSTTVRQTPVHGERHARSIHQLPFSIVSATIPLYSSGSSWTRGDAILNGDRWQFSTAAMAMAIEVKARIWKNDSSTI